MGAIRLFRPVSRIGFKRSIGANAAHSNVFGVRYKHPTCTPWLSVDNVCSRERRPWAGAIANRSKRARSALTSASPASDTPLAAAASEQVYGHPAGATRRCPFQALACDTRRPRVRAPRAAWWLSWGGFYSSCWRGCFCDRHRFRSTPSDTFFGTLHDQPWRERHRSAGDPLSR
jgi:hypothetical protein